MAIKAFSYGAICSKRFFDPVARTQNNNAVISEPYKSYMPQVVQFKTGLKSKIYLC